MAELFVIAYDIPDDRTRNKVADQLLGYGNRVQESVFECWLDRAQLTRLKTELAALIDPQADRVRYYGLCGKDVGKIQWDGQGRKPEDLECVVV